MAFGIMFDVKDPNIVCQNDCSHSDCAANRETANTPCSHCNKLIKAGEKFVFIHDGPAVHFWCEVEKNG